MSTLRLSLRLQSFTRRNFVASLPIFKPRIRGMASFIINQPETLMDENVEISITGLPPQRDITLYAYTTLEPGNMFASISHFSSNDKDVGDGEEAVRDTIWQNLIKPECILARPACIPISTDPNFIQAMIILLPVSREIDLTKAKSVGGFYTGCDSMGFIWSMQAHPENKHKFSRFIKNVVKPLKVDLKILDGFLPDLNACSNEESFLAQSSLIRHFKSPKVKRVVFDSDIKGTLFVPEGRGPFPAMITLYGAYAGYIETRASLLASHGIVTLALRYFGLEGLPKNFDIIDLEYFEAAAKMLCSHPKVYSKNGIGIVGISLGGNIALVVGSKIKEIGCSIIINGPLYPDQAGYVYKDWKLPQTPGRSVHNIKNPDHDTWDFFLQPESPFDKTSQDNLIPFHKRKDVHYLFQYSDDDRNCPTMLYAKHAKELLESENHENYKIKVYTMGHVVDPPYFPLFTHSYATFMKLKPYPVIPYGGTPELHHRGQIEAWKDAINFIKQTLLKEKSKL